MIRISKLCRATYARIRSALKPVFIAVWLNVGPNELLGMGSIALISLGLGQMWFPLAPLSVGLAGLAVAVINARMRP